LIDWKVFIYIWFICNKKHVVVITFKLVDLSAMPFSTAFELRGADRAFFDLSAMPFSTAFELRGADRAFFFSRVEEKIFWGKKLYY
jgi:hypothetical protein